MSDAPHTRPDSRNPLAGVLEWDWGTAYEMIISLHTIFRPKEYGIPAPWAAGVRKRLSPQSQSDLKDFYGSTFAILAYMPTHLIEAMRQPKDSLHFLEAIEAIPDGDFSRRMFYPTVTDEQIKGTIERALDGERLDEAEMEAFRRSVMRSHMRFTPSATEVRRLFAELSDPFTTRRRWLEAIREYHTAFFAEEERREKPALERMLKQAQEMSKSMAVPDLIERLSNGFTLSEDIDLRRLVLVPSIWSHPFTIRTELADGELLVAWGAHPPGYKLVPGELVPEEAVLVLRALSDPTRLRLLRLITAEPRALQSLAQEVKLSLPTVSHHIRELRGAGLIRLEVGGKGRDSKYTVRWSSAQRAFKQLEEFVMPERDE